MAAGENKLKLVLAAIDKTSAPIRAVNRRIESMTAPIRKVQRRLVALSREAGLPKVASAVGGLVRQFRNLAVVGAGAIAGIAAGVSRISAKADEISKFSRQIGIGAEDLQEWEFSAERAGVASSVFRSSVGALSKRVGELKAGKGALSTLLGDTELGAQLKAAQDTGEALDLITSAIAGIEDPTKKAALAAAAFSRAGLPMIRLANEGSEGIAALREEARRLGLVLSQEDAEAAEGVQDSLSNLRASATGLASVIAADLFPVVREIADGITSWTVQNRELIKVRVSEGLRQVVSAGRDVLAWVREVIPPTKAFIERIGGLRTIAIVAGAVFAASLLPAIVAIGTAAVTIGGALGAAGAAIAAAVGISTPALIALGVVGAKVAEIFVRHWDGIRDSVFAVVDAIANKVRSFATLIPAPIREFFSSVLSGGGGLLQGPSVAVAGGGFPNLAADSVSSSSNLTGKIQIAVDDQRVRVAAAAIDQPGADFDVSGGEAMGPQ